MYFYSLLFGYKSYFTINIMQYIGCDWQDDLGTEDDTDAKLEIPEKSKGLSYQSTENSASERRPVLYVEHRWDPFMS